MENEMDLDNPINVPEEAPEQPQDDLAAKIKELEAKAKETDEKNKQLFERAKKAEEKFRELKPAEPKEEPKSSQSDPRDIVRLAKALSGYSDEEVNFIYKNAKDANLDSIIEATKDDWVKSAIDSKREKVAQEKKIPESGNVPGGSAPKAITPEDMEKDPESHKKVFDEFMRTGEIREPGI